MRDLAIRNTHPSVTTIHHPSEALDSAGDIVILDESAITTEMTRLQAADNAQAYARARATEYPSMQEQLDLQYWDKVNSTDKWGEAVKAVKDKYPKG